VTIARHLKHRTGTLWLAALVHRLSGLALAIFLPLHFLALGLAIGVRNVLAEWSPLTDRRAGQLAIAFGLLLAALGFRAVAAVVL